MKVNKNLATGAIAFSIVGLMAGGVIAAQANGGNGRAIGLLHGPRKVATTAAQKTAWTAKMTARKSAITAKQTAIQTAISNNDYNGWLTAVGTSSPIAAKITAANFGQYVQAYNLMQQANKIMTDLGISKGNGIGWERGHGFFMLGTTTPEK